MLPVHEPVAVQDVGLFVADQVSVVVAPVVRLVGFALRETMGGLDVDPELTITLTLLLFVPPAFVQLKVYV